jgi:hypothetical protein
MGWIVDRNPMTEGTYLCTISVAGEDFVRTCNWKDNKWTYNNKEILVKAWQALPEVYRSPRKSIVENKIISLENKLKDLKQVVKSAPDSLLNAIDKTLINANIDLGTYIEFGKRKENDHE